MKTNSSTGRACRIALAALAAIGLVAPTVLHAQVPGVVFSQASEYLGASSSSGTSQNFGAPVERISANQRGDLFFINDSAAPNLVMIPSGTTTQSVIISNLTGTNSTGYNSNSVAVDAQGNLWAMNTNYGVVFIPVTGGVYPTGLDATKIAASCTLPVSTTNTVACNVPFNYGSLYFAGLSDITLDASDNVYGLDFSDNVIGYNTVSRVVKFDAATLTATVVLDNLPAAGEGGRLAVSSCGGSRGCSDSFLLWKLGCFG